MPGTPLVLQTFGGSTLDSTATLDENSEAIEAALNSVNTYTTPLADTSVTANTITVQTPAGIAAAYAFGLQLVIKLANTITATVVLLNVNGQGGQTVLLQGGTAPPIGSLVAGGVYTFTYDGANFQVQGATSQSLLTTNNIWTGTNTFQQNVAITVPTAGIALTVNGAAGSPAFAINSGAVNLGTGTFSDATIARANSGSANTFLAGPSLGLTAAGASGTVLQSSGNQTEVWQYNGGWIQRLVINSSGSLSAYGPVTAGMVDLTPDTGSYNAAVTGFIAAPACTIIWARVGKLVTVFIPVIAGTSNQVFFGISILAAIAPPHINQFIAMPVNLTSDNSALITDALLQVGPGGFTFFHNNSAVGWTAAGFKSTGGFTFSYFLV